MSHLAYSLSLVVVLLGQSAPAELSREIESLVAAHEGKAAVAVKHLKTGELYQLNADQVMPTASLIKVAVMAEAYHQAQQGKLDLNKMVTLTAEDKVPGSGILTPHFSPGLQISIRDAIRLMMAYSDNTATNLVLNQIGLQATVDYMTALGLPETRVNAKVFRRDTSIAPERSKLYGLGSTTAMETIGLLERIYTGKLGDESATQDMLAHLKACEDSQKVTRLLPPGTVVYHKGGSVNASRTVGAIIETADGPVALAVLTDENKDRRWTSDNAGDLLCSRIGKIVFDYYQSKSSVVEPDDVTLSLGARGRKVEILQRTLNARTNPSVNISVDGEFGAETEHAIRAFQRQAKVETTGRVDEQTWKALQPLLTGEPDLPSPEVVNHQKLPMEPADPLEGIPYVTAKAWAIADGDTAEVLWKSEDAGPRDFASVTKIMTAYIVIRLCEQDSAVLDEVITFSRRADATPGSTAGVRAGEQVSVRELLYGLMLPSGNDASVALAEHFGRRFQPTSGEAPVDPVDAFVAEMNRTAVELGMKDTHYENPHGLTAERHLSTPADLAKLAQQAWRLPLFRKYVSTRKRGARLTTAEGIARNVVWENSNKLLGIEGYDGIKTGTTDAAGACLVSTGIRDGRRLIVVVLGSTSPDARYVDTRNLYRYAWNQLQGK